MIPLEGKMKQTLTVLFSAVCVPMCVLPSTAIQPCSTEKVNHQDCVVVFSRRYPITLPTIQMGPGKRIIVEVDNPLEFETMSLDETGATALPGTDQTSAFLAAAVPNLKGFVFSNVTIPPQNAFKAQILGFDGGNPEQPQIDVINNEIDVLRSMIETALAGLPTETQSPDLYKSIRTIYAQLNQALAPIPKPGSGAGESFVPPPDAPNTPNPWKEYSKWRGCLLYELVGGSTDGASCESDPMKPSRLPDFYNALGKIATTQARLPSPPPAPTPNDPIFDQSTFEALVKHVKADIDRLKVTENRAATTAALKKVLTYEDNLTSQISALANTLTNVQKDFLAYYQNILLATHSVPQRATDKSQNSLSYSIIGRIDDPQSNRERDAPYLFAQFLGRQAIFSVNAVNNISTSQTSINTSSAKVSIATITVLYADPRVETSAGAIVSFVHNRSFTNQTITNPPPGSNMTAGDIVIAQTKTDPEVVPFVALHWRVGNDYLMPDHRRGALYATAWIGLNPYSTVPEYGAGPTFSWRSLMFSFLYNRAHQTALISGESQGQVVCNPMATAGATPPPCSPAPPAPITRTSAINAFAVGLSVRIPTSFAAGTGGVSR